MSKTGFRGKAKLTRTAHLKAGESCYTFQSLLDIYIYAKRSENVSEGSIANKRLAVKLLTTFLEEHNIQITPHTLDSDHCRRFIHYLRFEHIRHENNKFIKKEFKTEGLAEQTVNTHLRHLKAFYNFLLSENYIDSNPFCNVKQLKEPIDTVESLNEEEVKALLREPDRRTFAGFRDYVLLVLLLDTGLRITEALTLTEDKIDFRTSIITVSGDLSKTGKPRYIPFSAKLSKLLRELIAELKEFNTNHLFLTVYGHSLDKNVFRNRVKKYAGNSSIEKNVTVHMLRHTFCRFYLTNGGDIFTLQRLTGHSNITTLRKYLQFDTDDLIKKHTKHSLINNLRF